MAFKKKLSQLLINLRSYKLDELKCVAVKTGVKEQWLWQRGGRAKPLKKVDATHRAVSQFCYIYYKLLEG